MAKGTEIKRVGGRVLVSFSGPAKTIERYVDSGDWDVDSKRVIAQQSDIHTAAAPAPSVTISSKVVTMTAAEVTAKVAEIEAEKAAEAATVDAEIIP